MVGKVSRNQMTAQAQRHSQDRGEGSCLRGQEVTRQFKERDGTIRWHRIYPHLHTVMAIIITNVSLCWGTLIMGKHVHACGQGLCGKSLYLPLHFAVNLKLLEKNKDFFF